MLNKDSFSLGAMMGAVIPLVAFGVLFTVNLLLEKIFPGKEFLENSSLILASITLNLIVMRHYLVKLNYDKTGRSILAITFVYMVLFFTVFYKW
jgi:hypothetical protein